MKNYLSERLAQIKPSPTIAISDKARELRAAGEDVISLSQGEPDFETPEHIKAAAIQAMQNGQTRYTAVDGGPGGAAARARSSATSVFATPRHAVVQCVR